MNEQETILRIAEMATDLAAECRLGVVQIAFGEARLYAAVID